MAKVLVAVAWPYVNGDIHIGHLAGYLLPADIYARFNRFLGNAVLMVSGSDCYGTPITLEADKRGVRPEDIVEEYHEKNKRLFLETLNLSFDIYTKTTTKNHQQVVQDFFVRLIEKGLIFKDTARQYYSESERRFLPDRYVEGTCPKCGYEGARSDQCDKCGALLDPGELLNPRSKPNGAAVILKLTEHYFLDWPKLEPFLRKFVAGQKGWREWVLHETEGWLRGGLKPRAITRDIDWGIPIPTDRLPENLRFEGAEHKRIF
ncbi:MAG: class I tRNA ligase family protein, partial [Patescibacteria group bacterium]